MIPAAADDCSPRLSMPLPSCSFPDRRHPGRPSAMLSPRQRRGQSWPASMASPSAMQSLLALTLVSCLLLRPVSAVLIPFANCLPESYQANIPTPLQWVPLAVDAVFDLDSPTHNLRVSVFGNVTGSYRQVQLPPANSSDWKDPAKLDGKIVDVPDSQGINRATTLRSNIKVLTYEPYDHGSYFCSESLINGSCPLAPIFNSTPM